MFALSKLLMAVYFVDVSAPSHADERSRTVAIEGDGIPTIQINCSKGPFNLVDGDMLDIAAVNHLFENIEDESSSAVSEHDSQQPKSIDRGFREYVSLSESDRMLLDANYIIFVARRRSQDISFVPVQEALK